MGLVFNADEVFAMAVQIEANAGAFYRAMADKHEDSEHRDVLEMLADMEVEHERTFRKIREDMAEKTASATFDAYDEGGQYLSAIASGFNLEGAPSVAERLTGEETIEDVLRIALDLEKQAILFFLGIKDIVPVELGKEQIDTIIAEEKKHLVVINEELRKL